MKKGVIVIDCGAGSIRAVAVDETGNIAGISSRPNQAVPDPFYPQGLAWDAEDLFSLAITVSNEVISGLKEMIPVAITVTSFGVDGTFVDKSGKLLYPVISWQCTRTAEQKNKLASYFDPGELRQITGLQPFHFNTLFKLLWFREHHPEFLEQAHAFLFMPSLLIYRLCGQMVTDMTMAGTSMLTSLSGRSFSQKIIEMTGLHPGVFPAPLEAGTVAGHLDPEVASRMGLPAGIPVAVSGHDTQFALYASAREKQPVLSSGTWEVLAARTPFTDLNSSDELSVEFDVVPGLFNPSVLWVASGVIEWITKTFYPGLEKSPDKYETLAREVSTVPPGCEGLTFIPDIYGGTPGTKGVFSGISHTMKPAHFLRATFEALSFKCREGVKILEKGCRFKAGSVVVSGGGSRNELWNRIRADVLGIPLLVNQRAEATSVGAAMFAMTAAGVFRSPGEAFEAWKAPHVVVEPGPGAEIYSELFNAYEQTRTTPQRS